MPWARILVVVWLASSLGCAGGSSGGSTTVSAPTGNLEVALADSASASFQTMLLNVVAVRLNPSSDLTISETDKNWQTISPPPSSGSNELAVDFNALAKQAVIFNTGAIKPQAYHQIEVDLDPIAPGSIVPVCSPVVAGEGCISYPIKLQNPNTNLRAAVSVTVVNNQLETVVIDITPNIVSSPSTSNDSFTINPTIAIPPVGNFMATVTGTVVKAASSETVTAEVPGTSQVVTSVTTKSDGSFTLSLPAAAAGTAYDIVAAGSGKTFEALSNQIVTPGSVALPDFTPASAGTQPLSGTIFDKCTGLTITGAQLELLAPATNAPGADCSLNPPTGCVVVASAMTDSSGNYPLATSQPLSFNKIATGASVTYRLKMTASGYATINALLTATTAPLKCTTSGFPNDVCNFSLESGFIDGNVTLGVMNSGLPLNVLVMAEDSNTNTIENVTTATIATGASSAPFSIKVPTADVVPTLDLFASAQDLFGGAPEQATGHTIAVLQGVASPSAATNCPVVDLGSDLGPMNCAGHGSVSGTASTFDKDTTIVLSKGGVQLMQSQVGAGGVYNFCAPTDTYKLQRFESGVPVVSSVTVPLTAPTLISTPCSSICDTGTANTCFLCNNTPGVAVP